MSFQNLRAHSRLTLPQPTKFRISLQIDLSLNKGQGRIVQSTEFPSNLNGFFFFLSCGYNHVPIKPDSPKQPAGWCRPRAIVCSPLAQDFILTAVPGAGRAAGEYPRVPIGAERGGNAGPPGAQRRHVTAGGRRASLGDKQDRGLSW